MERRYRRLLRLLPADHRAARGEELLGLLLDLDSGRTRPSSRQAAGVVGLALRLRLPRAASLLFTAFLVAFSTEIAAIAYQVGTNAVTIGVDSRPLVQHATLTLLIPALLRLAIAVAWVLGAPRTTWVACAALLAYSGAEGGLLRVDLVVLVGLGAAAALRWWPPRRSRMVLLASIPLAMLSWTLSAAWNMDLLGSLLGITAVVVLLGTVGRQLPQRPSGGGSHPDGPRGGPTPVRG